MFKSLKEKLFNKEEKVIEEVVVESIVEEPIEIIEQVEVDDQVEEVELRSTQSIRVEFEEVINKLDQVVELVTDEPFEMNTIESLQHDSALLVEDDDIVVADNTQQLIEREKEMLLEAAEELKNR